MAIDRPVRKTGRKKRADEQSPRFLKIFRLMSRGVFMVCGARILGLQRQWIATSLRYRANGVAPSDTHAACPPEPDFPSPAVSPSR